MACETNGAVGQFWHEKSPSKAIDVYSIAGRASIGAAVTTMAEGTMLISARLRALEIA